MVNQLRFQTEGKDGRRDLRRDLRQSFVGDPSPRNIQRLTLKGSGVDFDPVSDDRLAITYYHISVIGVACSGVVIIHEIIK